MPRIPPRASVAHLRSVDPRLSSAIDAVGPFRLRPDDEGSVFQYLVRSIVYQQLSGRAAAKIWERVRALAGASDITPADVLRAPDEALREAGLSRQKVAYAKDLAARVADGRVALDTLDDKGDEAVIEHLVQVKGIGVWTVQMLLLFRFARPDVLPATDLGIQKGLALAYGLSPRPSPADVLRLGAKWAPYRSVASWYLWRLLEIDAA